MRIPIIRAVFAVCCIGVTSVIPIAALVSACDRDHRDRPSEGVHQAGHLRVSELAIDALAAPRDHGILIAGESVRIGIRLQSGTPPYTGTIEAVRIGTPLGEHDPTPLRAAFSPGPESEQTPAMEVATQAVLDRRAPSGTYQLVAHITDARGQQSTTRSDDFRVLGQGEEEAPAPAGPAFVQVVDVAGRRRRSFVRGERVTIHARLPGASTAHVTVIGPDGRLLASTRLPVSEAGDLRFPLDVPRLADAGAYQLTARSDTASAQGELRVAGLPWPPAGSLVLEAMSVYGGKDQRAVRKGLLRRGENLTLEARVAGGRNAVSLDVRLSGKRGVVSDQHLGDEQVAGTGLTHRVFVRGTWRVPETLLPGRYQLQLQAVEADRVSVRAREVLIL